MDKICPYCNADIIIDGSGVCHDSCKHYDVHLKAFIKYEYTELIVACYKLLKKLERKQDEIIP